jgi:hypothetical protein
MSALHLGALLVAARPALCVVEQCKRLRRLFARDAELGQADRAHGIERQEVGRGFERDLAFLGSVVLEQIR